jgi:Protein of unknown function (DUF3433)
MLYSLWWQVDYWCKVLTPWYRMRKGATPADQSLLRDYLSPNTFSTIWASFKSRDFAVLLSTLGSLLLQLAVSKTIFGNELQANRSLDNYIGGPHPPRINSCGESG